MTWEVGSGFGHLKRFEPIALELTRRGHRVFLAVQDVINAAAVFSELTVLQAPRHNMNATPYPHANTLAEMLINVGFDDSNVLSAVATAWDAIVELVQPDALVMDLSPTAMLAFRNYDIPKVLVENGYAQPPDSETLPCLYPWKHSYEDMRHRTEQAALKVANQVLTDRRAEPLPYLAQLFRSADQINIITLPDLDHNGFKPDVVYRGAIGGRGGAAPHWPRATGKRVFAYLNTFKTIPALLEGLATRGYCVLAVVTNAGDDLYEPGRFGDSVTVTKTLFDTWQAARQANYAITTGGDTVSVMFQCGTPVCVVPMHDEQMATAMLAEKTGAAINAVPPGSRPEAGIILDAFDKLASPDSRRIAATELAERYQHLDPVASIEDIVTAIEALMNRHQG